MSVHKKDPYTAIVVGSGCSVGLDVPVMVNFLDKVIDKLAKPSAYNEAPGDLAAIQAFITRAKGAAAYVKAELLNIEELYGMADMDEDLWRAAGKPSTQEWYGCRPLVPDDLEPPGVKKAFNRAIFHLAEPAGREFIAKRTHFPDDLKKLQEVKRESATESPLHRNRGSRWTNLLAYLCLCSFRDANERYPLFIQFNWDLALDRALWLWSCLRAPTESPCAGATKRWLPWYGHQNNGTANYKAWPFLARPHGGISWINNEKPSQSRRSPVLPEEIERQCYRMYGSLPQKDVWIDTPLVYSRPTDTLAGKRHGDLMEIVPPTWRKQATKPVYEAQWGRINQGLESVRRIVFIGYSLPKTDLYFRHFLALSLADNPHLPKVYVLNPGIKQRGGVRDNYLDLFAPLAGEGRLYGIDGRFGDPAFFDLHRALNLAERINP
jgi:hypothetical protein